MFFSAAWFLVAYGFNYASARWKRLPTRRTDPDALADGWADLERQRQAISQRRDRLVAPLSASALRNRDCLLAILGFFVFTNGRRCAERPALVTCAALYLAGGGIAQKVRLIRDDHGELLTPRTWAESLSHVPVEAFAVPLLQIATWVMVQVLFSIPLLVYALATRLLGVAFSQHGRAEKFLHPDPDHRSVDLRPNHLLSVVAALPIKVARTALPVDSRFHSWLDTVEAQLAFWQMQRRAVETGVTTAQALARLLQAARGVESARIHFLGHSFGGLVAASASDGSWTKAASVRQREAAHGNDGVAHAAPAGNGQPLVRAGRASPEGHPWHDCLPPLAARHRERVFLPAGQPRSALGRLQWARWH